MRLALGFAITANVT